MKSERRQTSRRERQAAETRREIVTAARGLFAVQGYASTSVAQIADAAQVSVQTIYDSVGSKRAIVAALNDLIDEEGGVPALAARIPATDNPRELLEIAVTISHNINERCSDIVSAIFSAASVEPELAMIRDESRRRHRAGIARLTARLAAVDSLHPRVTSERATDVIAALTDPEIARTFVLAYHWSWEDWHSWTVDSLSTLVLKQS